MIIDLLDKNPNFMKAYFCTVAPTITEEMTEEELATVYEEYKQNLYQYNLEYDRVSKIQLEENSRVSLLSERKAAASLGRICFFPIVYDRVKFSNRQQSETNRNDENAM